MHIDREKTIVSRDYKSFMVVKKILNYYNEDTYNQLNVIKDDVFDGGWLGWRYQPHINKWSYVFVPLMHCIEDKIFINRYNRKMKLKKILDV